MNSAVHSPPRNANSCSACQLSRSGLLDKKMFFASDEIRTPYRPADNLFIILTARLCNFIDGNMFMNVEKVRNGKKMAEACLQARPLFDRGNTGQKSDQHSD
jgi:hypothetical protein